jgi:hypothetical protein
MYSSSPSPKHRQKHIMGEAPKPHIEIIRPEVEILPPNHTEPRSSVSGSRVWLSVDSTGGTQRVYIAKPGPIATFLLVLAFGALLTISFVIALGVFTILLGISAVGLAGLLIYGLVRGALNRFR